MTDPVDVSIPTDCVSFNQHTLLKLPFYLKAFFANSFIFPFPRFITPLEKSPGFTEARFFFIYFEGKWSPAILPKSALCFPAHISCIIQRQYITDAGLAYAGTVDFLSLSCQPSTCATF